MDAGMVVAARRSLGRRSVRIEYAHASTFDVSQISGDEGQRVSVGRRQQHPVDDRKGAAARLPGASQQSPCVGDPRVDRKYAPRELIR